MKYLKQFIIILLVSFLGEILHYLIPLPVPASIHGILLMLLCLHFRVFAAEEVRETGIFLIEIMPVMFIPAGVGLMESWGTLKPFVLPVSVITVITIVTVMVATGICSQWVIRKEKKQEGGAAHE